MNVPWTRSMEWGLTEEERVRLSAGTQRGKKLDNCERIRNKKSLGKLENRMKKFRLLFLSFKQLCSFPGLKVTYSRINIRTPLQN